MRAWLLVLVLVAGVTGCSDDAGDAPPPAPEDPTSLSPMVPDTGETLRDRPTRTRPAVTRAEVRAARRTFDTWFGAFAAGNGARACPLQTPRFTRQEVARLAEQDRIPGDASCDDLVTLAGILFDTFRLDADDAVVTRVPARGERVAFSVRFETLSGLGYGLVRSEAGWRVDEDLAAG
jgi:hypothetical protein